MLANRERLRFFSMLLCLILFALLLTIRVIYYYLADPLRFPINTVKVVASYQHVTHQQLEAVMNEYLSKSFFSLPMKELINKLSALPWVSQVEVNKQWPDILKIVIKEQQAIAHWNDKLFNNKGEVFNAGEQDSDNLPHLYGPKNQANEVLHVYEKISKILAMHGLSIATLSWRDNQAWDLKLTNGLELHLGKRDLDVRITRFCKAYPAVFAEHANQLAIIDLRYSRGMAIQWKKL